MLADREYRPSIAEEKRTLRRRMRALRLVADQKEGPDAALAVSRQMLPRLAELGLGEGSVVAGYWPIITELDVRPLLARLHERRISCTLPAIVDGSDVLVFRRWCPTDNLEDGGHETRQPPATAEPLIPDALLVPLLAVDRMGHRLGQGRGWYDRTLSAMRRSRRPIAIGVGYAVQVIERVPFGAGDEAVTWILTGDGLISAEIS